MIGNAEGQAGLYYDIESNTDVSEFDHATQVSPGVSGLWFDKDREKVKRLTTQALGASTDSRDAYKLSLHGGDLLNLEEQMQSHEDAITQDIASLYSQYVLLRPDDILSFLRGHRILPSLVLDVAKNLKSLVATDSQLRLETVYSGEESPVLRISFTHSGTLSEANSILDRFDEGFWLSNCGRASGNVVVAYDLV